MENNIDNKIHEIRDPINIFVYIDSCERKVLNSRPLQRLRHIHQLATTYLVYPGATHRRFEHSLGVMEIASKIFDIVTAPRNIHVSLQSIIPAFGEYDYVYWRRVLRMAALCHDIGHLPFSHAAEKELLPDQYNHEKLTVDMIMGTELKPIWDIIKIKAEDVAKLAVGPEKFRKSEFTLLESVLSEIITSDFFGADRIDYLLRDSLHTGVAYGRFDHHRLIDTLRILPKEYDETQEPALGIEEGGLHSAEALLMARYFMYTQLYFHPVRRAYDIHLKDFLKEWLPKGTFSIKIADHIKTIDDKIIAAMYDSATKKDSKGFIHADRIINRKHFKVLYERDIDDLNLKKVRAPGEVIFKAACAEFGEAMVRWDNYTQKEKYSDFPVLKRNGKIAASTSHSDILQKLPLVAIDYVFISPEMHKTAEKWLKNNKNVIISNP